MKTMITVLTGLALLAVWAPLVSAVDDPAARAIMERVDARDDGDNQTADMQMILIDKHGAERNRLISTFTKDMAKTRCG